MKGDEEQMIFKAEYTTYTTVYFFEYVNIQRPTYLEQLHVFP